MRLTLRRSQGILAATVLLVVLIEFSTLPLPYPANPTVGSVPVDPELVVPALLGLVAVVGALRDGIGVGSIATGLLGAVTLWVATTSLYETAASQGGGIAWGRSSRSSVAACWPSPCSSGRRCAGPVNRVSSTVYGPSSANEVPRQGTPISAVRHRQRAHTCCPTRPAPAPGSV